MDFPPVYVLRHGQTEWNAQIRLQGRLDSALTRTGKKQALAQRRILKSADLDGYHAYSSPQGRAFHTASLARVGLAPAIQTDMRLAEIALGAWEGRYRGELSNEQPCDESEESALALYSRAPGGEGFDAVRQRCAEFLADLPGPSVLVTHGVTSRILRLILLGRPTSEIGELPGGQGVVFHVAGGVQRKLTLGA